MKKINCLSGLAVVVIALWAGNTQAASFLNTAGGLYSTGVNDSGGILTDNNSETHYKVRSSTSTVDSTGSVADAASAYDYNGTYDSGLVAITSVRVTPSPNPTANWVGIDASPSGLSQIGSGTGSSVDLSGGGYVTNTSAWISINDTAIGTVGFDQFYTYRTSFDLTGFDLNSVTISGLWASDNRGKAIYLNGNKITSVDYYGTGTKTQANYGVASLTNFILDGAFNNGMNYLDFQVRNDYNASTGLRVQFQTASGTVVPVPAAVWLFSSGLLGLFGLRRRGNIV